VVPERAVSKGSRFGFSTEEGRGPLSEGGKILTILPGLLDQKKRRGGIEGGKKTAEILYSW